MKLNSKMSVWVGRKPRGIMTGNTNVPLAKEANKAMCGRNGQRKRRGKGQHLGAGYAAPDNHLGTQEGALEMTREQEEEVRHCDLFTITSRFPGAQNQTAAALSLHLASRL